jgi:cathepsin A (carboxypeptidase C)
MFFELGPATIDENIKVVNNPYSWNTNASVIFLEQPVNVGYSYSASAKVKDTFTAGKDVYALLSLFFYQFPEYAKQDFHIAGESYGGHYVPAFAAEILSHEDRNINLKSILVGNGLTDGLTQYAYYRPMACGEGGYPSVLSNSDCIAMDNALPRCQSLVKSCYDSGSIWTCVPAHLYCNTALVNPYVNTGQNAYDVRHKCEDSNNLCYTKLGWISEYLNKPEVISAVGSEVDQYGSCNWDVNRDFLFSGDWFKPIQRLIPQVLEKIPVLIYVGDADFICNWLGNRAWTESLEWPGQKAFNGAELKSLKLDSKAESYGNVKSSGNFTFMRIYQAGHMVPADQPAAALDFYNRWLHGEWAA